ncbi:MAG TPA: YceI family protein [Puia sp.]|jgi:polyisoprenoid-binding protein YceI
MNRSLYPIAAVLLLAGSAFTFLTAQSWQIAEGYNIGFSSAEAAGLFKDFKGTILFDDVNPAASKFDVTVDVASINTGNGLQNKHAKSDEWFDAAKYPQIRYTSQKIVKTGTGYQVTGDLEMHGVKKSVVIPFTFQKTAGGAVFTGSFMVNRNDFKIGKPGGEVSDQLKVELSVPVKK